jgi:competence protein ComEC
MHLIIFCNFIRMNPWQKYPMVRLVIPFSLGIIFSISFNATLNIVYLTGLWVVFFLTAFMFHKFITYRNRDWFGIFMVLSIFFAGLTWHQATEKYARHQHFQQFINNADYFVATVNDVPVVRDKTVKTVILVNGAYDSIFHPARGKAMAYFSKDSLSETLTYGDRLIFSADIRPVLPPGNPAMFDYQDYLRKKHIFHSVYIPSGDFKVTGYQPKSKLKELAYSWRRYFVDQFREAGIVDDRFALATALVLGYDRYLDGELRAAYSNAGAMHVLCVSGLHVGIIYVVLMFLMNRIPVRTRWFHFFKLLLVLLLIWMYALITGLEPAVSRAALMFSFVTLGKMIHRKSRVFNTLAASALVLLVMRPNLIVSLGFQMSYLAVGGIVWLHPYIYNWYRPHAWLPDKIWNLIAVSLAAQIALAPLLMFYFHKVSLIFPLSNLVAIPLATLVLYGAMAMFVFSFIPVVSHWISIGLSYIILALNKAIAWISLLPFAYIEDIWFDKWQMYLLYGLLFVFLYELILNRQRILITVLAFSVSLLVLFMPVLLKPYSDDQWWVYQYRGGLAMDFISNGENLFVADSTILNDADAMAYNVENHWNSRHLRTQILPTKFFKDTSWKNLYAKPPFIIFRNNLIFIYDQEFLRYCHDTVAVDYVLVSKPSRFNQQVFPGLLHIKKSVILDDDIYPSQSAIWKSKLDSLSIPCHDVAASGAFQVDFPTNYGLSVQK